MSGAARACPSILARVPTITTASPPDPAADAPVTAGLRADLTPLWGASGRTEVSFYLRDDDGHVVGGLIAYVAWQWLYVDRLWVEAARRGQGHGAALLTTAETYAAARGCLGVHLDTFGEDALGFYRRQGYDVWGTLEGLPPGGRKHCLRKVLSEPRLAQSDFQT